MADAAVPPPEAPLPPETLYRLYRSYAEHENGLIDQRMKSGLIVHGFLFTCYGAFLPKAAPAARLAHRTVAEGWRLPTPTFLIALAGMAAAIITALSILAAVLTILELSRAWKRTAVGHRALGLPELSAAGSNAATYLGFGTTLALPGLILLVWSLILVFEGVASPVH